MMRIDSLIDSINRLKNPSVIGLDTDFEYLPEKMKEKAKSFSDASKLITEFNHKIIDKIYDIVPSVKVQVAYYEQYGAQGMQSFEDTVAYAKKRGLIVIGDVKRNDIGATASAYSRAYLGSVTLNGQKYTAVDCDFITVNAYLGSDGIAPFLKDCDGSGKGVFILVKTSNPASGQLQDKKFENGGTLYETVGALVSEWGKPFVGKHGYSGIGAVVGATHPEQAALLRKQMPHTFFLVPGYGAQGGGVEDIRPCFDQMGGGAIVNSSRGILCAYQKEKYSKLSYDEAAREAAIDMQKDLQALYK